jgi:hypothetical protein
VRAKTDANDISADEDGVIASALMPPRFSKIKQAVTQFARI